MPSRKLRRAILIAVLALVLAPVLVAMVTVGAVTLTGEEPTPSGRARNESVYVEMRDGTKIAIDIWYPARLAREQRVPTLIRATRYGRAQNIGPGARLMIALGKLSRDPNLREDIRVLNEAGYAVVRVDARGSGASYGVRPIEWSADEVADYGEIIDWIARQPWSNGLVGAYGISYDGNAAEVIAATRRPALKAVAPMYSYFDPFQDLIRPGGVFDSSFISRWSEGTRALDTRLPCRKGAWQCWRAGWVSDGIKPVDADRDASLRAAAVANRDNPIVLDSFARVQFRDDPYGNLGTPFDERVPYRLAADIEASGVAMNVWAGWYDSAVVDGALARFQSLANPQRLIIGPFTHGAKHDANPYAPVEQRPDPDAEEQYRRIAAFLDPFLKQGRAPRTLDSEILYFTLGENGWKTTRAWPPAGIANVRWHFAADGGLSTTAPREPQAVDTYRVDFTATTGTRSRWHTISGPDVVYADRRDEDAKLLTYTSDPLASDTEISGNAVVMLNLASSQPDGALHVYLEDVAPDGRVTYLTEGVLRTINRKIAATTAYDAPAPQHSLLRADAAPMVPGQAEQIVVPLYAISARVQRGHRIRIAIAGHNADVFERIPAQGDVELTVHRSAARPSYVDLPQKPAG